MSKYFESVLNEEKVAELGLRLVNRDSLNDASLVELTGDVTEFVHALIRKGEKGTVEKFLQDHKHHLTPTMRDMISIELKSLNPGKI
jgi:hypothetical protein